MQHALKRGDWSLVADDACRTAATVRGPSIIVVPHVQNGRTVGQLLFTDHWDSGHTAVTQALDSLQHAVSRLYGYQTEQQCALIVARRLLNPDPCTAVDVLGQIRLPLPPGSATFGDCHVTVMVDPTGQFPEPAAHLSPHEQAAQSVMWSTLASALAREGPLHPKRIASRRATTDQRDLAGAFTGVLGGFIYMRRILGVDGLIDTLNSPHADSIEVTPLSKVLSRWTKAASDRSNSVDEDSLLHSAHELLATGVAHLMTERPDPFGDFVKWFRSADVG